MIKTLFACILSVQLLAASNDRVVNVTKEQFAKEVERSEMPVVIDCYASWCGPCVRMSPIFSDISNEWQQVKFVKINIDAEPALAKELKVRSIPTFLFYKGGKLVGRHTGSTSKEDLVEKMKKFVF